MVQLTIDGKKVEAREGMTIVEAAEEAGIHIPNLCYLKGMKGIGACRLCMVEIEGLKAPMTACTTKVKEGMSIKTSTPEIDELRRFVLDLILSMHPMDCMTCPKAGICRLQQYAYDYNVKESTYTRKLWGFQVDDKNPFIRREPDYCVLCARCVRVCREQGTKILDFMGRGVGSKVTTPNDKPMQETECTFCGSCVDACPVNALTEASKIDKGREWEFTKNDSVCTFCGAACSIKVSSKDNRIVKVTTSAPNYKHTAYICALGRYGFDYLDSPERLKTPLIKTNGQLVETTWDEALKTIAEAFKSSKDKTAIYTSGSILTEDAITIDRFASEVLKTTNVGSTVGIYADTNALITGVIDPNQIDLLLVLDLKVSQKGYVLPAIDAVLRRLVSAGTPLVSAGDESFADIASAHLKGSGLEALRSLIAFLCKEGVCKDAHLCKATEGAVIDEAVQKAGKLFMEAKNPLIITLPGLAEAASNLTLIKGELLTIPFEANAIGVALAGVAGSKTVLDQITKAKGIRALYVIGETTITARPNVPFMAVHTTHLDDLAKSADVVLPLTTPYESNGTIIRRGLRQKVVNQVIKPIGEARAPREALEALAEAMGAEIKTARDSDIKRLLKVKWNHKPRPFEPRQDLEVDFKEIFTVVNRSMLSTQRIKWLREVKKL
jgi:NADH dehydrogenase/NADH:ubiquinone oxidoreductase subunit G